MHALTAAQLLRIWERGANCGCVDRAIAILMEVDPASTARQWATRDLRQRDQMLLAIRAATFGRKLSAQAPCPKCDTRLEVSFDTKDLEADVPDTWTEFALNGRPGLQFRLPNSLDLVAAQRCGDVARARRVLAERLCVADMDQSRTDRFDSDYYLMDALSRTLEEVCAGGFQTLRTTCPACAADSEFIFDVAEYFWREVEAEAIRLMHEVHRLSRGYGWAEEAILSMTSARRQAYLEMLPA